MVSHTRLALAALVLLCVGLSAALAAEGPPAVQIHGYMQNRGYFGPGANPEFRSERISVSATAALPDDSTGYVEVYYQPWAPASGLYLESAYYETALGAGRIRVGKGRNFAFGITPSYGNRKTSNYGIVAEAITQDRIQGIQYLLKKGDLDFGASVHTSRGLGVRNIGEIPGDTLRNPTHQVPHLSLRDPDGALRRKLSFSTRIGTKLA